MSVEVDSSPSKRRENKLVLGTGEYHDVVYSSQSKLIRIAEPSTKCDKDLVKEHTQSAL
jgi:hypothetical protein